MFTQEPELQQRTGTAYDASISTSTYLLGMMSMTSLMAAVRCPLGGREDPFY